MKKLRQTPRESSLTQRVVAGLRHVPYCWWFKVKGGSGQRAGIPDFVGCVAGKFFAIEVKRSPHEKLSKLQAYEMDRIIQAKGGAWRIADQFSLDFVMKWLMDESKK